ncbi:ABC1 family protein C10F6.14c [Fusarium oxysporum f. sp. albedinis]|nr:ABC1 family protein C10F6.14c [Fusarium oxysporum f. sp. albedinis]
MTNVTDEDFWIYPKRRRRRRRKERAPGALHTGYVLVERPGSLFVIFLEQFTLCYLLPFPIPLRSVDWVTFFTLLLYLTTT